jgi:hypothetical protein
MDKLMQRKLKEEKDYQDTEDRIRREKEFLREQQHKAKLVNSKFLEEQMTVRDHERRS